MPGLVIDGDQVAVDGVDVQSWLDDAALRRSREDGRRRATSWVRSVVLHTMRPAPFGHSRSMSLSSLSRSHGTSSTASTYARISFASPEPGDVFRRRSASRGGRQLYLSEGRAATA